MITINTVSRYPTHFLRAVDLIEYARKKFKVPSENWPYPTEFSFGIPKDHYYAEVWVDGMDWQNTYWIIEQCYFNEPDINPLIIFESHEVEQRFDQFVFNELINAILYYRRDKLWINKNNLGVYADIIYPFLKLVNKKEKWKNMRLYSLKHASQPYVEFWLNKDFVANIKSEI